MVATIQDGAGYTHAAPTNIARVEIHDAEITTPVLVTVTPNAAEVEVGTDAEFTFSRTGDNAAELTYSYELLETGEVTTATEGPVTGVTFDAGSSTDVISVSTVGTTFNSGDGITLRVRSASELPSLTYRVGSPDSAKVGVTNVAVVLPVASIETEYNHVLPDSSIWVEVKVEEAPSNPIDVSIAAADNNSSGSYTLYQADGTEITNGVVSVGTSGSAMVRVAVANVTAAQVPGTVHTLSVTLSSDDSEYTLHGTNSSVDVTFDDGPTSDAVLTIVGPADAVDEGDEAMFTITATSTADVDLTIGISVSDLTGRNGTAGSQLDYVDDATKYVRLAANATSVDVTFSTKDVAGVDLDGVMVATIQNGEGYTHSGTGYANVYDTDGTGQIYALAGQTGIQTITEGDNAVFRIERQLGGGGLVTTGSLAVPYAIVETEEVTTDKPTLADRTVMIPPGQSAFEIMISTDIDLNTALTSDAGLRIRILNVWENPTATYRIGRALSPKVTVTDKKPTVSFVGNPPTGVTQGRPLEFTLQVEPPQSGDTTLFVFFNDSSKGIFDTTNSTSTPASAYTLNEITIPSSGSIAVSLPTINPGGSETGVATGDIMLSPPSGVVIQDGQDTVPLEFYDNETTSSAYPRMSLEDGPTDTTHITSSTTSVALFNVLSTPAPTGSRTVVVNLSETGNFLTVTSQTVAVTSASTPVMVPLTDSDGANDAGPSTITATLVQGSQYSLADSPADTTTATVTDVPPLPDLSIADATEIFAGTSANFVVTSSTPFTGRLMVSYTPEKMGGNYLNEADGTDSTKTNTNSGLARTIPLDFTVDNGVSTATLSFATVDDSADADRAGSIMVTLNADPAPTDTYTVSTAQDAATASIPVIRPGRTPTVSITGGEAINEGQTAVFTVSTDELDTSRSSELVVNLTVSGSGSSFITGTPESTVTISGGSTSQTYELSTTNDNVAGGNSGYIIVTLGTGSGYNLGDSETSSARIGVRDNAGDRRNFAEAYIADASATVEGNDMVFTVNLTRPPSLDTYVYFNIHSDSTAEMGEDYTQPYFIDSNGDDVLLEDSIRFRRGARFPRPRPGETSKQIRIPIIHDNYDELDETIVIELIRATNNYNPGVFDSRATGTITDHASDIAMVSVEDAAGLEGDSGNSNIPVTVRLNIPSSQTIMVDWATSVSPSGTNLATAVDDFVVEDKNSNNYSPAEIAAGQLTGTFNVQVVGDTDPAGTEPDETFTVTISDATSGAVIDNATATVTIKSDEISVLSIADGATVTDPLDSNASANAVFTITTTKLPTTNPLTVHYTLESANFLAPSVVSPTTAPIMFDTSTLEGTLTVPVHNDDVAEAFGPINVTLIEERSGPGNTYSVDPANESAKVDVIDGDSPKPYLSIAGPADPITEGNNVVAEFVVTAKDSTGTALNPSNPITIRYNVADHASQNFIAAADEGNKTTTEAITFTSDGNGNYIYTISVPIAVNRATQTDGDITVSLRADQPVSETYELDTNTANLSATATIKDTIVASFRSDTYSAQEDGTFRFEVNLSKAVTESTGSVLVYYDVLETGTATAGQDFIQPSNSYVQFRPYFARPTQITDQNGNLVPNPNFVSADAYTDDETQYIEIQLIDDDIHELDSESIDLRLSRVTGPAAISTTERTSTGTINNNDATRLIVDATSAFEGDSGMKVVPVTVRIAARNQGELPTISSVDITFEWTTSILTAGSGVVADTAEAGDFVAVSDGTGRIPAGQLSTTIEVQIEGDTDTGEGDETFTVTINNWQPSNDISIFGSDDSAKVTIKDDDDMPVMTIGNTSITEITEGQMATFTVTSTKNPTGGSSTIDYTPVSGANFLASNSNAKVTSPAITFQAAGDVFTATLSIPTQDDTSVIEANGLLTITLNDGTGYRAGDPATASVHVSDNDATMPKLSITGPSVTVYEGVDSTAEFTITATADPGRTMDVRYTPSESGGDFLASNVEDVTVTASSLNFSNSSLSDSISIPIEDDNVFEKTDTITVTLVEQETGARKAYTLGSRASATATVQDDDGPVLSISAGPQVIETGDATVSATFVVTASSRPNAIVPVRYSFDRKYFGAITTDKTGSGTVNLDFRAETRDDPIYGLIEVTPPKTEVSFSLLLNPNGVTLASFANGEFEVTLSPDDPDPGSSIRYAVAGAPNNVATVAVADDDVPELSISAGPRVIEGADENATFIVTATTSPNTMLPIKYSFDRKYLPDSNSNKTDTDQDGTLDFTNSATVASLTVRLNPNNDTIPEFTDGEFEVTLDPVVGVTKNYAVALTPRNTATVDVLDGDKLPEINISPKVSTVAETNAGPAMFTITATGANLEGKTLAVQYKPAEVNSGDFLNDNEKTGTDPLSVNLTFSADAQGDFKQDISVFLDDDSIAEATGEIEVVLHGPAATTAADNSYRVGANRSAKITVYDDDAPELSIADGAAVTEGTDSEALFPVTAKASPNRTIVVQYKVEQPGTGYDFVAVTDTTIPTPEWPTARLDFTTGKTTANLPIALIDNNRVDSNGVVRVTLVEPTMFTSDTDKTVIPSTNPQYTVSTVTGEDFGDVMVMPDNDPTPMLTIAAPASAVAENEGVIPGESAVVSYVNYVISSTVDLGTDFKVRYDPSEVGGNFLRTNQEDIRVEAIDFIASGSNFTAILPVPIDNDEVGENSGEIQVELLVGDSTSDTYSVATNGSQIQKTMIHDDDAPVLSIGDAGTVSEWTEPGIEFPITALVSPDSLVFLRYTLSENSETDGDFIADSEEGTKQKNVNFTGGQKIANLVIPFANDDDDEGDSIVTVTLETQSGQTLENSAWNLASPNTPATATVINFEPRQVSVTSDYTTVATNSSIEFNVTISPQTCYCGKTSNSC